MSVWAFQTSGGVCSSSPIQTTNPGSDGSFTFNNIPEGSNIYVQVGNPSASSNYTPSWYKANHSTAYDAYDCLNATPITVTAGQTTNIGNIILQPGGTVTGSVMDGSTPVGGNSIFVGNMFMPSGTACSSRQVYSSQVKSDGTFAIHGVPLGANYFRFSSYDPSKPYPTSYWDGSNGSTACANGITVNVTAGDTNQLLNFHVARGVTISGKVTNSGANVPGMSVSAYSGTPCGNWVWVASGSTDSNGNYSIVAPAGGTFFIRADSTYNKLNYVPLWWDGASGSANCQNAQSIANTQPGATNANVNFAVSPGAIINGKLTDGNSQAITSGYVNVYTGSACSGYSYLTATSSLDSQGNFSLYGVAPGNVLLRSGANGKVSMWWDGTQGSPMCSSAQQVALSGGQTYNGFNFVMPAGGSISGVVRDTSNAPVSGVWVVASYGVSNGSLGAVQTNGSGQYTINNLPAGSINVTAQGASSGLNFDTRWWEGAGSDGTLYWFQAKPVPVVMSGNTGSIDFKLHATGTVSGTVTDHTGAPLANVNVFALLDPNGNSVAASSTAANGTYTLRGVPNGSYIHAKPASSGYNNVNSWWTGSALTSDPAKARPIALDANASQTINFQSPQGAIVTGTITDASNAQPAAGVPVRVDVKGSNGFYTGSSTTTGSDGTFTIKGIPATTSGRLGTSTSGPGYCFSWWDGVGANTNPKAYKALSLTAGTTTSGFNLSLTKGASISGTVTDGTVPLQNVQIMALVNGPCAYPDQYVNARTDYYGKYTITGIPPNTPVTVRTDSYPRLQSFAPKWRTSSGDTTVCSQAASFSLASGAQTTGVDFTLAPGGSISGKITSAGSAVPGMIVSASSDAACSGSFLQNGMTDWDGNYTIYGLPLSSNIYVGSRAKGMQYGDKYWDGAAGGSCASAQPVVINPGQPAVTGINLVLLKISTLMGALMQLLTN
ncbi:MSCRAMM family protein [Fundidesulfovibrio soli]|uniref:MSCRAMM family protein n=1 Tax=Fundidesulfovibrio soli TaxID=2922716 RepID=UPI001FAF7871